MIDLTRLLRLFIIRRSRGQKDRSTASIRTSGRFLALNSTADKKRYPH
jgi:hypothetical protein